jgi:hypothetical protein
MIGQVVFDPLLPWAALWAGAAVALVLLIFAAWRGLRGWWLRALAAICGLAAVAQPSFQSEERRALSDIVLLVIDESASQKISDRADQTADAVARIEAEVAGLPNTELRKITVADGAEDAGTLAMTALAQALAEEPRARVAGAILVTDGQVHDIDLGPEMPAPLNVLLTGHDRDWDRRLLVKTAPAFGIIGEPLSLTVRIDEQGRVPAAVASQTVALRVALDGAAEQVFTVPVGQDLELPLMLDHGGQNVVQLTLDTAEGELTDRNNAAVIQINGVRDRLRVLLVSGEPYAGERTWRNLLKSDSAVDLVHFTILRPPDKQDGVPVSELSLIAFPTRELFVEKINEFDLIIFDRYRLRGILPSAYLDNIRDYVKSGGAVLVAAGPDFASAESLYHSGLGEVLPARPTARMLEGGYIPRVSDTGKRHPVTEGLEAAYAPEGGQQGTDGAPTWGRWLRLVELADPRGQVVMDGPEGRPLLVLNREGEGRVALLASDQAWLWGRGFEGGGPQLELLRRLAHWLMKEPELEEEALTARAEGQTLTITRRTLGEGAHDVTITAPDGTETTLPMTEVAPGRYEAIYQAPDIGLYRLKDAEQERVAALGPAAPKEFEEPIATEEKLAASVTPTLGGFQWIEAGLPDMRQVREGRPASGRGWIGITPRNAYQTLDVRIAPLLPAWAFLLLAALFSLSAWIREGRR